MSNERELKMLALNDTIRVLLGSNVQTLRQTAVNILHYKVTGLTGTGATEAAVLTALETVHITLYKLLLCQQADYAGTVLQRVHPLPTGLAYYTTASAGAGTGGLVLLPGQTCGSITKQSAFAGRRYRGRIYIPWPSEADNADGRPIGAYTVAVDAWADVLTDSIVVGGGANTLTLDPVIWSPTTQTSTPFLVARVNAYWTTQRRRGSASRADF